MKNISWIEAIKKVLSDSGVPLHYSEISEKIVSGGVKLTDSAAPDATVSSQISTSIKNLKNDSPFIRIGGGYYSLNNSLKISEKNYDIINAGDADDVFQQTVLKCIGMYWRRDLINWISDPEIYGKRYLKSKRVNFCEQRGVYVLYDHRTVVYVGRSIDRPIGQRLYEHTSDRLNGRWDRFSWFGLHEVSEDGKLISPVGVVSLATMIAALEAILIEAMEPPQNRKRGDFVVEYMQTASNEFEILMLEKNLNSVKRNIKNPTQ